MSITTVEDFIINNVKTVLGATVKDVDSLPGPFTESVLRQIAPRAPAVYVAWLGGRGVGNSSHAAQMDARWGLYVITDHASGYKAQQRGDANTIGANDIAQTIVPSLHGQDIPDIGTLKFKDARNLFTVNLGKKGLTVYAIVFGITLPMDKVFDLAALTDFVTFHAEHSLVPGNDEPPAIDEVTNLNL